MERQSHYAGLTAAQRLDEAGPWAAFDAAAYARNCSEMIHMLVEIEISDASWFVDMIIANPRRYGY